MTEGDGLLIEGEVNLEEVATPISGANVSVRLEDVSLADASSKVVAEVIIDDVSIDAGRYRQIPFALRIPRLEERARYTLAAHVDTNRTHTVTDGDYITMESVPVSTSQARGRYEVRVRLV